MKKAVVTVKIGNMGGITDYTIPTIESYAKKINSDFVVIDNMDGDFPHYAKYKIYDIFKDYQRILFLDSDLIVRPDCPDLFEVVPEDEIGMCEDGSFFDYSQILANACKAHKVSIPKWDKKYYNSGVIVASHVNKEFFKPPEKEFKEAKIRYFYEEAIFNIRLYTEKYKVKDITYKFNRMVNIQKHIGEHRLSSYIVHYASAPNQESKLQYIKKDLESWEKTAPDYFYPRQLHVDVGGGIGDQLDTEPVIRYMREKMYPDDHIRVRTNFPCLFKHLDVDIIGPGEQSKDKEEEWSYFRMNSFPGTDTPIWQYLAHTLCHSTDFSSAAMLRRTLPAEDKQIKLSVSNEALRSVQDTIKDMSDFDIEKLVLVHPGMGWPSKTFPAKFYEDIVEGLVEADIPVALIGKSVSNKQGVVDLKPIEGALDLINLFDLEELIALISKSYAVFSNDSAPVHIAGAFDPWIIMVPSCKHPEHVLPFRHGSQDYKTKALYKKLTCDAVDSRPTNVYGEQVDYVVGDIWDYLPDSGEVISCILGIYE